MGPESYWLNLKSGLRLEFLRLFGFRSTLGQPESCILLGASKSWLETREDYGQRLKRCCDEINRELDVENLCRAFPKRIKQLKDAEGGRLSY